jgi:hypothetical protein
VIDLDSDGFTLGGDYAVWLWILICKQAQWCVEVGIRQLRVSPETQVRMDSEMSIDDGFLPVAASRSQPGLSPFERSFTRSAQNHCTRGHRSTRYLSVDEGCIMSDLQDLEPLDPDSVYMSHCPCRGDRKRAEA